MKNKKIIIPLLCVACVLILILISVSLVFISGNNMATVRCYVSDGGSVYMLYQDRPVKLNYKGEIELDTGDEIFVIFSSSFAESFPEQTKAHFIIRVSDGTREDLVIENENYIKQLEELGFSFD